MNRADIGEKGCAADNQHNAACGLAGIHQQVIQVAPFHLAVNEHTDNQAVHHGDGGGLGRRENTAVNAAQNNHGHQKAPKRRAKRLPAGAPGRLFTGGLQVLCTDLNHNDNHQGKAHQNAGENAAHEHIANGHAGNGGVHHEGDGGRNDNGDGRSRSHQRRGKGCGEAAAVNHGGNQNDTQRRHSGGTGAGNRTEEASHDNAHDGNAAPAMADAVVNKLYQTGRNSSLCHDVAGEDEKRNRQKQELRHAVVNVGGDHGELIPGIDHGQNGGKAQSHADGYVQKQHDEEGAE
ncbi:hypothetical protein SDC9_114695 [bioreactor metagenome]|uniref:Uncharacterized protein n=1 Tax=bioreactor metagenome TaxID=1076179 RepID=A0A645BT34_9ZZZZ